MSSSFDEHIKKRDAQRYPSTRPWTPNPNKIGAEGEKALADLFRYPPDTTDMPEGDGGVDREIELRRRNGDTWWCRFDAKACQKFPVLGWFAFEAPKVARVDLLCVYLIPEKKWLGWQLTEVIQKVSPEKWRGVLNHKLPLSELRSMSELLLRYTGRSRHFKTKVIHVTTLPLSSTG